MIAHRAFGIFAYLVFAGCGFGDPVSGGSGDTSATGFFAGASNGALGCSTGGTGPIAGTGGNAACATLGPATYAADVAPIFAGCTGEQCHAAPTRSALVDQPSFECCGRRWLVHPGDPAHSYLVDALDGIDLCNGQLMPLGGPELAPADRAKIVAWICAGAPDD